MGLVDETYINKEKHFLYLHWKWNDREDTRSILTVLLLHFISDTRVEQVANEVYRASQGWRPGVLRLGCWSWLFQSPTWMIQFMGPFGAVHLKWSNVPWASSFFFISCNKIEQHQGWLWSSWNAQLQFGYHLCSSTKIEREMYISVCTKKVERRVTNKWWNMHQMKRSMFLIWMAILQGQ